MIAPVAVAVSLLVAAAPKSERPKVFVLDVQAGDRADQTLAETLTGAVVSEVSARGYYEVLSSRDVGTLLGVERQRQLLGCADDSSSCQAELAGALGTSLVLAGTLSRFGEAYQLALQLIDTQKQRVVQRSTRLAKSVDVLRLQVIYAVAEATGAPLPPPPSKALAYSALGGGAALVIAGATLGVLTLGSEATVNAELDQGRDFPQVLKPYDYYAQQTQRSALFRSLSLVGLCAGAALVALGIVLYPPDVEAASTLKVALLFTGTGAGLAAAWQGDRI